MTDTTSTTPAVWIGDLAAYNAGINHGRWIYLDAEPTVEKLAAAVGTILDTGHELYSRTTGGAHEEWHVCDYEGFGPIKLDRYESLDVIIEHATRMGDDPNRYFAYIKAHGATYAANYNPENVDGPYTDHDDYAWEWLDEHCLGALTLGDWLQQQGMPEELTYGVRFDPEAFLFALSCNGGPSMVQVGGSWWAVGE